jgi:beta-xylosidase
VTVTFCFTPEHRGIAPHHTSAPVEPREFADFCSSMLDRYARPHSNARLSQPEPA